MRILIPLDGSTVAERAVTCAETLLARAKAPVTVVLLRVAPAMVPNLMNTSIPASLAVAPHAFVEETIDACYTYLCAVQQQLIRHNVAVELSVVEGPPAEMICTYAQAHKIDMILMATHGRSGFSQAVLGSVAHSVTRDAHLPTLLLRATSAPPFSVNPAMTLLVPLDGSPLALAALFSASQFAQTFGGAIRLLHVLSPQVENMDAEQERQQQAHNYLTALSAHLVQQHIPVTAEVVWGQPVDQIGQDIARNPVDLIVMATHGRVGLQRMFDGSVTESLMGQVQVPLLVLHPTEEQVAAEHFPMLSPHAQTK